MGAGQSTALRLIDEEIELLRETRDFARWTLGDVAQLTKRFHKTHGMAITASQLDNLLLFKASDLVGSKEIFAVLDTNRDGRIDGLEFIAALTCVCRAGFEEKARFAFELFDFNQNGSLSLTELALLMKSVWVGMSLLTGHAISKTLDTNPSTSVARFLQLAQHAFDRFDRDGGASLQYEEFIEWARSNREFMLQVEQFRVISEKAVGLEEAISLPDGSDNDSDLEEEAKIFHEQDVVDTKKANENDELRRSELSTPPWVIEPTFVDDSLSESSKLDFPPPINVELEWLHGYASTTVRNAIRELVNGDLVYIVSKYAIVYTPERHQQRHYFGHRYPITCVDVNSTGTIVATGDAVPIQQRHSEIHVWNGLTLECLSVLSSFHVDSIASLAFPAPIGIQVTTPLTTGGTSGKNANLAGAVVSAKKQHHAADSLLVSIGTDANASMALWDWQNAQLLASGRAINKRKRVLCVAMCEDGHEILVGGEHFLVFHHIDGRFFKMKKPKALDAKIRTMPICMSATYHGPHTVVVGTARGEVLQFNHMQLTRVIQAHAIGQSINVCALSCRSMVLFTAGKDGMIKQWDSTLHPIGNPIDLHQFAQVKGLEEEDFRVHSMAYDATNQRYFVGTRHGHLFTYHEANQRTEVIASSHRGAEVDGLATSRFGVCFATCSASDRTVRTWNMRRRRNDMTIKLPFPPTACVFSTANGGEYLAVGGKEGSIALFRAKSMTLLSRMKNTQTPIQCMRFHPSGSNTILAVGCTNGLIYMYSVDDNDGAYRFHRFALLKPLPGEPSPIVNSLDFSVDGRFLKSQHGSRVEPGCENVVLRFWQIRISHRSVSRITTMSTIRNVQWQTYSSEVGWHVNGLHGCRVASLSSNSSSNVLATLDTSGELSFRHFPCVKSQGDTQRPLTITISNAHVRGTGCVSFALHDSILLSTSRGYDKSGDGSVVCQWSITKEVADPQPRTTHSLNTDAMWNCLVSLGLEHLYFFDDSYVARSNHSAIDAVIPVSSLSDSSSETSRVDARWKSEAPDLDLSLVYVHGINQGQSCVNQVSVGMSGSTGFHNSLVYGAGTLLVSLLLSATQVKQQRIFQSGLRHDISSVVKHSNSALAVGSHRENRALIWQWEPTPRLLGVLRGPSGSSHVLTAFDPCDFSDNHGQQTRDLAAAIWYSPSSALHVIRFYHWRQSQDQDHLLEGEDSNAIQADMTRLPIVFGFFTPLLISPTLQENNSVGFVSGGVDHVTFWSFTPSTSHIVCQNGVFGRHAIIETAICGTYAAPYVLTGMMSGTIVVWDNSHAAFSLPAIESIPKSDDMHTVVSLVTIPAKQQVLAAIRRGLIVQFSYKREADRSKYRANSFLVRLQVLNLFDDLCVWKRNRSGGKSNPVNENESLISTQVKQAYANTSNVRTLTVFDELQNGFAIVLSCGVVLHVDGQAFSSSGTPFSAKVILDFGQQVTAMGTHPIDPLVALGNSDGRISVYHLESHSLLRETRSLTAPVKALAWQPERSNARIAVSLANGEIAIITETELAVESLFPCGPSGNSNGSVVKKWCWDLKFSPRGCKSTWLAAACRNYHIYVYACSSDPGSPMTCELAHDFAGHTAPIVAMDFSVDGCWLQSATSSLDCQLMRWQISDPGQENDRLPLGEPATWHSWTVPFAGPVDGLKEVFKSSVTSVDRIRGEVADGNQRWSSRLPTLLVGTETGRVLLGWFPLWCGEGKTTMFKEYDGYYPESSSVDRVCFIANNDFAITAMTNFNGSESVVLFWKTDYEDEVRQLLRVNATDASKAIANTLESTLPTEEEAPTTKILLEKEDQRFADDDRGGGDEFMAVKPWIGAIREPTVLPPGALTSGSNPPVADIALEFVYGVNPNATNTRNDVFYADDSWEIVYSAASFGVVYNTKTRTQLLNATHSGQMISCVAVHPARGDHVVTAEIAGGRKRPRLVAWDANSGSTITQIETVHTRGVTLLAFAPSGDRVASVGMDDDHVLAIYSLNQSQGLAKFKLLASMKTSKQPVYALAFHNDMDTELVTAGLKHVLFWTTSSESSATAVSAHGRQRGSANGIGSKGARSGGGSDGPVTLSMKKGLFGTAAGKDGGSNSKILAAVYVPRSQLPSQVVTAQQDGSLFVWKARQCVDAKQQAHKGNIYALAVDQKRLQVFYSGGQDGKVNMWNSQLELLVTLEIDKLFAVGSDTPLCNYIIKSIAVRESRILLSTDGGDVAELVPDDPHTQQLVNPVSSYTPQIHLRSHFKGELWGLATHPTKLQFATAGDDGSVRLWDAPTRSLLSMNLPKNGSSKWRTIAFSSDGSHLAVGSSDGHVLVLNEALDQTVKAWRCCPKGIAVVKYAPESRLLAIGTHDQGIYVYDGHTYKPMGVCRGHSSTVTHLDFSCDGRYLQSTSTAGELLFWDLSGEPKQVPSATDVRDTPWSTWTLPFGWPVQGIWAPGSDGSDVNAVTRSNDRQVVATGDDFGLLKLFQYPCISPKSPFKSFAGHASHVTNCSFTRDDYYLLTTGGLDNTICQYKYYSS